MNWRSDRFPKILCIIGGLGTLELAETRLSVRAKSVCVIPKGIRHRLVDEPGHPVSLCGIALRAPGFRYQGLLALACDRTRMIALPPPGFQALFQELLAEERLRESGFERMKAAIVWRILVLLARARADCDDMPDSRQRVARVITDMQRDFWRAHTLDSAARAAGLSRRRFTQLFRKITTESWHDRLERLRISHARHLLMTTAISIRATAFECGYTDLAHFYRTFRKQIGQTPADVRTVSVCSPVSDRKNTASPLSDENQPV